jgi:sensor histidine kinase regulating citrate/malate metabolism
LYEKNLALLEENHAISIQRLSYESINNRLENMRRTRHDLRHHAALLQEIRKNGDLSALDELINMYTEQNYLDQPFLFCENETVNIVLVFYSETAYKNNISFSVKADIPEDIFFEKKDLAVLFGNILENAADACKEVEGERFIDLAATYKSAANGAHSLSLAVKNSFITEPTRNENGVFRSTKHAGEGIGISSVESITKKYDGACSFTHEGGIFTVSVILYEQKIK